MREGRIRDEGGEGRGVKERRKIENTSASQQRHRRGYQNSTARREDEKRGRGKTCLSTFMYPTKTNISNNLVNERSVHIPALTCGNE